MLHVVTKRFAVLVGAASLAVAIMVTPCRAQWEVNGVHVVNAAGDEIHPQIVSDGAGGAIMTWKDHRGFNYDIWAQRINASGFVQWTAQGVPVCTGNGEHDAPVMVADGSGGAIIAWLDHRGSNYDVYAQRLNASGVPQWTPDGEVVCNGAGEHHDPAIASDGAGGAIVVWRDERRGAASFGDLYGQRMSGAGVAQWTAQGVLMDLDYPFTPHVVADDAGGAFTSWEYANVNAKRASPAGANVWTSSVSIASGSTPNHTLASDGLGGGLVAWVDYFVMLHGGEIYAKHLTASGVDATWPQGGVKLCDTDHVGATHIRALGVGGGGIFTWDDHLLANAEAVDIRAQHVTASGQIDPAWGASGALACSAAGNQLGPSICSDGGLGAVITWYDYRDSPTTGSDIYVQHVSGTGTIDPSWTSQGVALCKAANNQMNPELVADGSAGAIVVWEDGRNGTDNAIYAQRIYASGGTTAVGSEPRPSLAIGVPHPNPSTAGIALGIDLPAAARVSARVVDLSGRLVRVLAMNQELGPGRHELTWDGTSLGGVRVGAGIYMVRVNSGPTSSTRRILMLR